MTIGEVRPDIAEHAAHWVARVDRSPLSEDENKQLEAWLGSDARHAGAYARALAVYAHTERARALGPSYDPARIASQSSFVRPSAFSDVSPIRRRAFLAASAAAVAVCVTGLPMDGERAIEYRTIPGETRTIPLSDGSRITLNTASTISVELSRHSRQVRLQEGEAVFDVAKDASRPFVVIAGGTSVTAVGTSFAVRRLGSDPVDVLVREGVVDVADAVASDRLPVRARANTHVVSQLMRGGSRGIAAVPVSSSEIALRLAWRQGMIAFEGATLEAAAAEFGRYNDTPIIVKADRAKRETITGLYSAYDPLGFARAVSTSIGLKVDASATEIRLQEK